MHFPAVSATFWAMIPHQISVSRLSKVFSSKKGAPVRALDGLSLDVRKGEIFGLLGQNGAGKTTLLRIMTTLLHPTEGQVRVCGYDVVTHPLEVRRNICAVLQENAVEIYLSVEDNLLTYARFQGIDRGIARERIESALERFGLGDYRKQKVIDLSGGLKRRVQVAKVFMADRPVVFLDEATTGMDPINKRATLNEIREQAKKGRTIFLTTHLLDEAEELCDTIAIIDKGKCVASGDVPTIKSLASRAFTITVTYSAIDESLLGALLANPELISSRTGTTVRISVRSTNISPVSILARLTEAGTMMHVEVGGATLEDAFIELLSGKDPRDP